MKVKIGPYNNWLGPYQLAEILMFWVPKEKDEYGFLRTADRVHKFGEWLAHGYIEPEQQVGEIRPMDRERYHTWLFRFLTWIQSKKKRTIKVKIDPWDTWSMDHTLAHIILPMLKQLNEKKHGAPYVDLDDVPEHLHPVPLTDEEKETGHTDSTHFQRWDWIISEMIFAFENKLDDSWEKRFESGENDLQWLKLEDGMTTMVDGPKHTKIYDWEGRKAYEARIQNGFRLFGKYYSNLWD
jgi:hypothetical protein